MGKFENLLTTSANCGSNIQCLFPTVGQCTTSPSVSAVIGRGRFCMVPFLPTPVPDCVHGILYVIYFFNFMLKHLITQMLCQGSINIIYYK